MGASHATTKESRHLQVGLPVKYVFFSDRPKYKAQLVSKGFKQEHDINYDESFLPVVKMMNLQLLHGIMAT